MNDFDPSTLKYNDAGLLPVIAQDEKSFEVLMLAWMNKEAIERTLETGKVTYWSRSRSEFWIKGETSGNTQDLVEFRLIVTEMHCLLSSDKREPHAIQKEKAVFLQVLLMDLN